MELQWNKKNEPLGFRASPLWIFITIAIIVIIYMIIFYLWIIGWKSIGHCAVSEAISVTTCSLRLPIVPLLVGELNSAAHQSADCLLSYQKRNDLTHCIRFWLFFTFFLFSQKIVMNPQVVLLLLLVAVPCTSASMLLLPFCNV